MLTEAEFVLIAREVKTRSGAVLTPEMSPHIESRLVPTSRREGFASVNELIGVARIRPDGVLWNAITDALAQTETRFFRDKPAFQRLQHEILPAAFARRGHERVRVWSAACATGQEPYSLAMMLEELRQEGQNLACEIVASDFSDKLIEKARSGLYTQFEVQRGLPIRKLIAHFEKAGDLWRISDRLRAGVRFQTHNLLQHPGPLGQFDVILCCNVLSSFDGVTRLASFERLADALAPDGVIILGANETLPDGVDGFELREGICVSKSSARRAA